MKNYRQLFASFLAAVISVLIVVGLRFSLQPILGADAPLLLFTLAVIFAAWYGGFRAGLLGTVFSALVGTYFFIQPYYSLFISESSDVVRIILFILIGIVVSWLLGQLHKARDFAVRQAIEAQNEIEERNVIEDNLAAALLREQELREEAEAMNRTKDEFLGTVSHELRTPLNAILGWTQMIRKGVVDESHYPKAIETIERNARSQAKLVEDLLDVTRIITGKMRLNIQPLEVRRVIEAAMETVRPAAEAKNITLGSRLANFNEVVSGDSERLQQIIWNLLSNAIKFTPANGRVEVSVGKKAGFVEIYVTDTGRGIEPEFLPFVFDRFRQADSSSTRKHGGLGLGLSIVRQLVELHGGAVRAESEGENKGSTFIVSLPTQAASKVVRSATGSYERIMPTDVPAIVGSPEAAQPSLDLQGINVVVIDDEPDARSLLQALLVQLGATVKICASAVEGLAAVQEKPAHLLICDIGMPLEDGYELIKKIRGLPADLGGATPAIALTGFTQVEDRIRALSEGYQIFVPKPVEPDELIAAIKSLADMTSGIKTNGHTAQSSHN